MQKISVILVNASKKGFFSSNINVISTYFIFLNVLIFVVQIVNITKVLGRFLNLS